jgi:amino acid adenylation domain-containing protein
MTSPFRSDTPMPGPSLALTFAEVEQTVPDRFESVAREVPDRIALRGNGRSFTYRELNTAANRIAHSIVRLTPTGPGRVAYLAGQSPEMVLAALAILKAGKTYVAVHPKMPAAARRAVLRDVRPDLLLATKSLATIAAEDAAGVCGVLTLDRVEPDASVENPARSVTPRDPSTLFYTSGSTGQSKGVVKSHRAVMHRVWLSAQHDGIRVGDRQSLLTHCSFSASESDMFGALLQGATVCTFDPAAHDFFEFRRWLEDEQITLLHPPVLYFRRFLSTLEADAAFPHVRLVALAGDVVLPSDLQAWARHSSAHSAVLHRFSITETALLSVSRFERDRILDGIALEAGRPVAGKTLRLVDADGHPVAVGEAGELLVESDYLADGYWNRPEETEAAFSLDPATGRRTYRTGDVGRFTPEGNFVFLGRRDDQVKIRGYRVELREVESVLAQLHGVREAACIAIREPAGEQRIHAYVVWHGPPNSTATIRARLRDTLPDWKMPAEFHSVDALPSTWTGKINRRLLGTQTDETEPQDRQRTD